MYTIYPGTHIDRSLLLRSLWTCFNLLAKTLIKILKLTLERAIGLKWEICIGFLILETKIIWVWGQEEGIKEWW